MNDQEPILDMTIVVIFGGGGVIAIFNIANHHLYLLVKTE